MRIAVIGAGGVGGYFGGRLAASGVDITFIARGAHLQALQTRGLRIESVLGNLELRKLRATDDPAQIGQVDVVFFAVKLYDTEAATSLLPPLIGPDTVVIPFQNGVDSVDVLTRKVGPAHVAGGSAYVAAVISEPGVIRHTAMETLIFGEIDGTRSPRLERLLAACRPAGFEVVLSENIQSMIWSKFVGLSTFSGMTAVTRSPLGVLRNDPNLTAMMQAAFVETMAVARAKGVTLPSNLFTDLVSRFNGLPAQAKSSMLEDLERGKRLELPWLSGAVVRIGHQQGVETPIHRFIATVLAPHVYGSSAVV